MLPNDNNAPGPNDNNAPPPQRQRIPLAAVAAEVRRAGGSVGELKPNFAQGWDLFISGATDATRIPSNALDNPGRDRHLATFYSDAVQQSMSEVDLVPSPEFAARWGFLRELPTPDVAIGDLKRAIFEGQYRFTQDRDAEGRLALHVDPPPDSGDLSFTSREANGDPDQATFDPVSVQELFRRLNIQPDAAFVAEYPHAVPYQYRPPLNPRPAAEPAPTPPPSQRDQIQQNVDEHNAVDTQNAMDVLNQAEEQQRAMEEEIRREAEQRREQQAELDRQQTERQRQQEGEGGGRR